MKKLLRGIAEFHHKLRPSYRETFARLALGQSPDCLFFACSDSRVVPNLFASTEPGDLFVVRNIGNFVPPCDDSGLSLTDRSEGAAIEFAVQLLGVRDIVVCGHSECGAMRALTGGGAPDDAPNLREWLGLGDALAELDAAPGLGADLPLHNRLSQLNVLRQLRNLRTYPAVAARLADGTLALHGWWFDLADASVLRYDDGRGAFLPIVADPPAA